MLMLVGCGGGCDVVAISGPPGAAEPPRVPRHLPRHEERAVPAARGTGERTPTGRQAGRRPKRKGLSVWQRVVRLVVDRTPAFARSLSVCLALCGVLLGGGCACLQGGPGSLGESAGRPPLTHSLIIQSYAQTTTTSSSGADF